MSYKILQNLVPIGQFSASWTEISLITTVTPTNQTYTHPTTNPAHVTSTYSSELKYRMLAKFTKNKMMLGCGGQHCWMVWFGSAFLLQPDPNSNSMQLGKK